MIIRKHGRRLIALLTAAVMLLGGCGGSGRTGTEGLDPDNGSGTEVQMGRYVEELIKTGTALENCLCLTRLEDGRLAAFSSGHGPYLSSDEGKTWEPWQEEWYWENCDYRSYECVAIAPDGTLYAADWDYVYEVDCETLTALFETEEKAEQICFLENDIMLAATAGGVFLYDRKNRTIKESDEILDSFVKEQAEKNGSVLKYGNDGYNVYLTPGEGECLYLVCDTGIYRHTPGGGMMEKILEGSICTIGDPSRYIYGMLTLSDNRFLMLYQDAVGIFSYDADMPTLPERELRVYSLEKDDVVQKAVSLFMKEHQDVYVNYEVGLDENSGQTKEDVIKTLNAEILAGHGPDVLILDGFPMDSYIEKGLLKDISGVLARAEEKEVFFHNIAAVFETDGKLPAIPVRCRIPAVIAPADELAKMSDLKGIADASESLRQKRESGSVTGTKGEQPTLQLLAMSCAVFL